MTALSDICDALKERPPVAEGQRRFILVGVSAYQSLVCEAEDHAEPKAIAVKSDGPRFDIVRTDEFKGWAIVDRPEPSFIRKNRHEFR